MPEKKPFDLSDLMERLKAKGVPMAEDAIQAATAELFAWAQEGCIAKGGFFAMAAPLLPMVSAEILKLEDKLDGVQGQ